MLFFNTFFSLFSFTSLFKNPNNSCQLIIMFTPVRNFFKVEQQNGAEWAFAVGVGAGSLLMALVVKLLSR